MEDEKIITVIVPCYNVENTIKYTLQSLENQTYKRFKVILVNDGSTDNTLQIIEEYKKHSVLHINVISKMNAGVSKARNVALDKCDTEWISFLDADDEFHPQFLEILASSVSKHCLDMAACRYKLISKLNYAYSYIDNPKQEKSSKYDFLKIYTHHRIEKVNFCNFLYKRSIINQYQIRFAEDLKFGEDTLFLNQYLRYCDNGGIFIDETLYSYYVNNDSATHKTTYYIVQNIEAQKRSVKCWQDDEHYSSMWGEYVVARAIWAAEKTFAICNKNYYKRLQKEMDVKKAMEYMSKYGDERSIRLSARAFLINPKLFYEIIRVYSISKGIIT